MKLPTNVRMVEVGPRDGFQNVTAFIPTEDKLSIIKNMIASGVREMEITSFVNPKWVPQMADAEIVAKEILGWAPEDFRAIALAPNKRGVENAIKVKIQTITYVLSCSESHNKKNVNRSIEESLIELKAICREYRDIQLRVSLAVSFGCPFEGEVTTDQILQNVEKIAELGIREIILCDTIGIATPKQVYELLGEIKERFPDILFGLHFHDTRGAGMANIMAGLLRGIYIFETAIGGLGGCPFAPGSAGNTATEDILTVLSNMGIETGIDIKRYLEVVEMVRQKVDSPVTGRIASICKKE